MSALRFLAYNNAVPVGLAILLLGSGAAFAATDPQAIYASQSKVVSVDNSYIANKSLSSYSPTVRITDVKEDSDNFYVSYELNTVDIKDYVWQDVTRQDLMTVAKGSLDGKDLGTYVTSAFARLSDNELDRLIQTQEIEKRNLTPKVIATEYSGLIGKILDTSTQEFPPVSPKPEPTPESAPVAQVSVAPAPDTSNTATSTPSAPVTPAPAAQSAAAASAAPVDTTPPVIQVLGKNPAVVSKGTGYVDLGAMVTDNVNNNLGIHIFQNGIEMPSGVSIDTTVLGTTTIEYRAADAAGNEAKASRDVIVQ